jgi:hypothetical protein
MGTAAISARRGPAWRSGPGPGLWQDTGGMAASHRQVLRPRAADPGYYFVPQA